MAVAQESATHKISGYRTEVGIPRSGSNKISEFVKEGPELSLDERLPPSAPAV